MTTEGNKNEPTRVDHTVKSKFNVYDIVQARAIGRKRKLGHDDEVARGLYNKFYNHELRKLKHVKGRGGIFNLEFSLNGRLLAAACEGKQVLLFDAANQRHIKTVEFAHLKCVNCIRFLDDRSFATCSDDTSIKIWDIRQLKSATRTLHGHSNWVKNIEYSEKENVMVTSAFDGSIHAWNLKNASDNIMLYDRVFLMNGLMRTKLSPEGDKMVISTTNGYMIIIHDLNLSTLATDLRSFRPNLYRLMQISEQNFPVGTVYNYLFNPARKRNRIEFIDDFPNDAEVISSLQIHPHAWCAVSRNLNGEENEEWTSVHDIQKRTASEHAEAYTYVEEESTQTSDSEDHSATSQPTDLWMGYTSLDEHHRERLVDQNIYNNIQQVPSMGIISSGLIGGRTPYNAYFRQNPEMRNKIVVNLPRLTHFAKEKNVGKGFIKELCFSSDGRIICSPYDKGVRLLGFNEQIQELTYCVPDRPKELTTLIELKDYHKDVVVSCKFSPTHLQLVSGCLGSEVKWYQPVL